MHVIWKIDEKLKKRLNKILTVTCTRYTRKYK